MNIDFGYAFAFTAGLAAGMIFTLAIAVFGARGDDDDTFV
jgi:hypothetical protein